MFPELLLVFFQCFLFMEGTLGNRGDGKLVVIADRGDENPRSITYIVGDTLQLSCELKIDEVEEEVKYDLKWHIPLNPQNSQMRHEVKSDGLLIKLKLEHLQESDSGTYTCEALRNDSKNAIYKQPVQLSVKAKQDACEKLFVCAPNKCILPRFKCDGFPDCENGDDESNSMCGDACEGKIKCGKRCIPLSSCCHPYGPNCTTKIRPDCCPSLKKGPDYSNHDSVSHSPQHYSDMTFLQTTIYTVIGCATVFMLIVTILVIVICRVHIRRSLLSTFPPRQHTLNTTAYHRTFTQEMGVCDVDVYLNRAEVPGGVLVTYNINNGVQILSETIEPPPYSEVVSAPPREGPPPPYSPKEEGTYENLQPLNSSRGISPKPEVRAIRRGLSVVQVSSEPALSTLH